MSDVKVDTVDASLKEEVEKLDAMLAPDLKHELVTMETASTDDQARIAELMNDINLSDTNSILFYGSKAQERLTTISDNMLEGVRNKDVGPAGQDLNNMVTVLRGFDVAGLDPTKKRGFWARLFGRARPVVQFIQEYEGVRRQIDTITDNLEDHKTKLLTDIAGLDRLYDANLDYYHSLELYIAAGEEKLKGLDQTLLPALAEEVQQTDDVLKAQELRDMRSARDDLERRIHDLMLTRQVAMQSLPSIRMVQENDKGLVSKISSTLVNTVPLWRQQLAQAVTVFRSQEAAKSVKAATDLTNDLLEKNAETLRTANREVREQVERGVFDIEAVKRANENLIATIEESLQIADEGKRKRRDAERTLEELESELKSKLASASSHQRDVAAGA
ncbi:tellurium resistance protein [Chromatiales bacterium (ex Bugula neritina AB1)]|nr:tellurium resistance protein [Chromatiales bacterium (ex Bugula neritina AB1)]